MTLGNTAGNTKNRTVRQFAPAEYFEKRRPQVPSSSATYVFHRSGVADIRRGGSHAVSAGGAFADDIPTGRRMLLKVSHLPGRQPFPGPASWYNNSARAFPAHRSFTTESAARGREASSFFVFLHASHAPFVTKPCYPAWNQCVVR